MKLPYKIQLSWKQITVAFLLGAVCGAYTYSQSVLFQHPGMRGNPEKFHERRMREFNSRLGLTADQQNAVKAITEEARAQVDVLRQQMHPQFEIIRQAAQEKIREVLNPEQQKRFDQMNAEQKARFERERKKHPWGSKPGGPF